MLETTIGALSVGDVFKFSKEDIPYRILAIEEISSDFVLVSCKATINFYKHERYKMFKGKLLKNLIVYVGDDK